MDTGDVYKIKRYIASTGVLEIHVYPKDYPNENSEHFHTTSKQRNIDTRFNIETLQHLSNKKCSLGNNGLKKITDFCETNPFAPKLLREEHNSSMRERQP